MKYLKIHISIILLFCVGFFLTPNQSYACSKKTAKAEQSGCARKQSGKPEQQACCKTNSCKKDNQHGDCSDQCKHNSCRCGASVSSISLPASIDLKTTNHFAELKKQKFGFRQAYYPTGFFPIWLPPKIS